MRREKMESLSSKHSLLLWYLVLLCCPCDGLSPPYDLHWSINGACVHLTWKHSHTDEPLNGYYVSVRQENNHDHEQTAPDFVHLDRTVRSTNIQGLMPDSIYQVKVVAYSGDVHESSKPVTVSTKDLELLMARNLTITGISTTAALFQWEHDAKHTIHDTQFKLTCRGARQYTDNNDKLIEEIDDFDYSPYASSQGKESYFSSTLQPNTKYTCHINTVAETVEGPPTKEVTFRTAFGAPTPPPKPKILVHHNSSFTVQLYHSNERFGPISHYKVFAVPMKKEAELPLNNKFIPLVPSSKLLKHAVSPQVLTHESAPTPFLVGTYQFRKLPNSITFNGNEMRLSFKPKTHYSFITAVFTKAETEESEGLHSFSAPTDPPVFISADLQEDWIKQHQPVAQHFTIIVTCTLVSVTLLFVAGFLSAFASNYYKGKKRDAYFFTVADDDSSEDELYSKPKPSTSRPTSGRTKGEVVPLLRPSPQPSPTPVVRREDFSESQTYYNPAFEEATAQKPSRSQPTSQDPVPTNYKYPSNSPAKVPVSSIHSSPVNVNSKTITSPNVYGSDLESPLATNDPTGMRMYQTIREKPQHPIPSTPDKSRQTGNPLQPKQYYMSTNSQNAPLTTQGQQTPLQLPLSAYTQLVTSVGPLSHSVEDDTSTYAPSIAGATNSPNIGGNPRIMRPDITTGARYLPYSPKSHSYKRDKEYARLQLQDIPITNADDVYRGNS